MEEIDIKLSNNADKVISPTKENPNNKENLLTNVSASTDDEDFKDLPPPKYTHIDLEKELAYIISEKKKANELNSATNLSHHFNANITDAISIYTKSVNHIKSILDIDYDNLRDFRNPTIKTDKNYQEFIKEYKLILSNLSIANRKIKKIKESVDIDQKIINLFDSSFEKSYVRLLDSYINLGEIENADKIFEKSKAKFDEKFFIDNKPILDQYKALKDSKALKEKEEKNKIEKEAKPIANSPKKENQNQKPKSPPNSLAKRFFKFLFGAFVLFGSSFMFYYIYKNRNRYRSGQA